MLDSAEPAGADILVCGWYWADAYLDLLYGRRPEDRPSLLQGLRREARRMCATLGVELAAVSRPRYG